MILSNDEKNKCADQTARMSTIIVLIVSIKFEELPRKNYWFETVDYEY